MHARALTKVARPVRPSIARKDQSSSTMRAALGSATRCGFDGPMRLARPLSSRLRRGGIRREPVDLNETGHCNVPLSGVTSCVILRRWRGRRAGSSRRFGSRSSFGSTVEQQEPAESAIRERLLADSYLTRDATNQIAERGPMCIEQCRKARLALSLWQRTFRRGPPRAGAAASP